MRGEPGERAEAGAEIVVASLKTSRCRQVLFLRFVDEHLQRKRRQASDPASGVRRPACGEEIDNDKAVAVGLATGCQIFRARLAARRFG